MVNVPALAGKPVRWVADRVIAFAMDVLFGKVGPGSFDYPATASTPVCPECRDTGISMQAHARGGGWRACGCAHGRRNGRAA